MSTISEHLEPDNESKPEDETQEITLDQFNPARDSVNEKYRLVHPTEYHQIFVRDGKLMYRDGRFGPAEETSWDELQEMYPMKS